MREKKALRKLGYFKDREGMYSRYIFEQNNWNSHLINTKRSILSSAETKNKNLCVILGSGWLLDIPIDELSKMFEKIILVDVTHPKQIEHFVRKYDNVSLIEKEITQISNTFFSFTKKKNKSATELLNLVEEKNDFGLGNIINDADLVVSANLVTQLSVFFQEYLSKKKLFSEDVIKEFSAKIQKNHLDNLPKNKTCLIVDYNQRNYDLRNNLIAETERVYTNLPEKRIKNKWQWDFDLKGNFKNNEKVYFDVKYFDV